MLKRLIGIVAVSIAVLPGIASAQFGNVNSGTSVQFDTSGSQRGRQELDILQRIYPAPGNPGPFPNNNAPLNINSALGIQFRATCNNPTDRQNNIQQGGQRTGNFSTVVSVDACHPGLGN